ESARPRGVGFPEAPAERARPVGARRHSAHEGELPAHLRRRTNRGGLSRWDVVRRLRSAGARADHSGTSHRRPGRRRTSHHATSLAWKYIDTISYSYVKEGHLRH